MDTLIAPRAGAAARIAAVRPGLGGVYALAREAGALLRLTRAGVDTVVPPGVFRQPMALAVLADSPVVFDRGAREAVVLAAGRRARSVPLGGAFGSVAVDERGRRAFLAVYGQVYEWRVSHFAVRERSLVEARSLDDGRLLASFGAPRRHGGEHTSILGNHVAVAWNAGPGEVALGWPLEGELDARAPAGALRERLRLPLGFSPPASREWRREDSPVPVTDFQTVLYAIDVDSAGRRYVLTSTAPKRLPVADPAFVPPPQAVDVYGRDGAALCRVPLPFEATSFAVAGPGELLVANGERRGGLYRVYFRCPAAPASPRRAAARAEGRRTPRTIPPSSFFDPFHSRRPS